MVDLIISTAELLMMISYLFRDILYLRILISCGLFLYVVAGYTAGYQTAGMTAIIFFNSTGTLINLYQIYRIIQERKPISLPDHLKEIYQENFGMLKPLEFLKFYKLATLKTIKKNSTMIVQGSRAMELFLIIKGQVDVIVNQQPIISLGPHFYVGEMSYLSGKHATATAVAAEDVEVLVWEKEALAKLEQTNFSLYTLFNRSIAENLTKKIHSHLSGLA